MKPFKTLSRLEIAKKFFAPTKWFKAIYMWVIIWWLMQWALVVWVTHLINIIIDAIQGQQPWNMSILISMFGVLFILYGINVYISSQHTLSAIIPISNKVIMQKYVRQFLELSPTYVESIWSWKRIHIMERWVDARSYLLEWIWRNLTKTWWRIIFSLIYVATIDLYYGLIATCVVMVAFVSHYQLQQRAFVFRKKRKDSTIDISKTLVRHIQSHIEIMQANKQDIEVEYYTWYAQDILWYNKHVMWYNGWGQMIAKTLIDLLRIASILLVSYGFYWTYISIADFVSMMMILALIDGTIWQASRMYVDMLRQYVHVEKLREVFDEAPESLQYSSWEDFIFDWWNIELKNITFAYDERDVEKDEEVENNERNMIFNDLSMTLQWWKKTALVWISWSGKSTLVKLIAWYLSPNVWMIEVDGQGLHEVSLKSYYAHIWYLTQEPNVFDGTVIDNLTYAISWEVNQEKLKEIIHLSKCDFIYDLPDGLETEIWERWVRLSWWQRQRIAIAKVFLKNPDIIILDEPTSALDSFSEEGITEAMHNLFAHRTVIIIAHRLQTVKEADDIIVLDQWKIAERGTHTNLVSAWWMYARMLELQSWF